MASNKRLENLERWNRRLGVAVILLLLGWIMSTRHSNQEIMRLERSHYGAAIKVGEILKRSLEQEEMYVAFLVEERIIASEDLDGIRADRASAIAAQERRIKELRSRYGF